VLIFNQISNFHISFDQTLEDEEILPHIIFKFGNVQEAYFENVSIINDKNMKILHLFDIKRKRYFPLWEEIKITTFVFNNVTVVNNTGKLIKEGTDRNLFSFYSPIIPLQILFQNSVFENNNLGISFFIYLFKSNVV